MNSQEFLLYFMFTIGTLYGIYIIINVVWEVGIMIYRHIADEISFYIWEKQLKKNKEK